jgi:hypothetical protein
VVKLVPVALLAFAMLIGQATDQPPLAQILERVGHYVRQFEDDFAIVVSDEDYTQQDVVNTEPGGRRSSVARRLRSEMVFAWLPETQSWLAARHVLTVDGAPVADSKDRMDAALAAPGPEGRARIRRLRDEGARFNIGRVYRNFNDPTLVLQFLDPGYQGRFAFSLVGKERANEVDAWKIAFAERGPPSLITAPASDLPSNGLVWIGRVDGTVVRTSLTLKDAATNTRADIVVDYRRSPKLGIEVPVRMVETYMQQALVDGASPGTPRKLVTMRERIECVATYSNFRRFETSGRLVTP